MHVPVKVLLASMDSNEISEWMAYEEFAGPLDSTWSQEVLGQIHELLQHLISITVQAHSDTKKPPKVQNIPRPWTEAKKERTAEEQQAEMEAFDREIFGPD